MLDNDKTNEALASMKSVVDSAIADGTLADLCDLEDKLTDFVFDVSQKRAELDRKDNE